MQGWVRKSHGTGTGFTTQQGFWIPLKPSAAAAKARLGTEAAAAAKSASRPTEAAAGGSAAAAAADAPASGSGKARRGSRAGSGLLESQAVEVGLRWTALQGCTSLYQTVSAPWLWMCCLYKKGFGPHPAHPVRSWPSLHQSKCLWLLPTTQTLYSQQPDNPGVRCSRWSCCRWRQA